MIYSVLPIDSQTHMVFCKETSKAILTGTSQECWDWKEKIDAAEQNQANKEYLQSLKKERTEVLVSAGYTLESAEIHLKKIMPYLF